MKLLRLLGDGQLHSGEELGLALGISRTAVWKQLAAWRKRGLVIDVVPGKGYRVGTPLEWWSEDELKSHLGHNSRAALNILRVNDRVASTNDEVLALMRQSPVRGVVCLAEEQTAGRGRRGREWISPVGVNFYGSVGWIFAEGITAVEGLSLAVGVAIVRALQRYGVMGAGLKWPNDVMMGNAKLGGILIELQAESDGPCIVVVGVGLNLRLPVGIAEKLGRPVTALEQHVPSPLQRNRLGGLLLDELLSMLSDYEAKGFSAYREDWLSMDVMRDQPVEVTGLDRVITGIARGVDTHGALCIETSSGLACIHGGEVSLRRAHP